jgi:hypothetical protein
MYSGCTGICLKVFQIDFQIDLWSLEDKLNLTLDMAKDRLELQPFLSVSDNGFCLI